MSNGNPASTNLGQGRPDFIPPFVPGAASPSALSAQDMNKLVRAGNQFIGMRAGKGITIVKGDLETVIQLSPDAQDLLQSEKDAGSGGTSSSSQLWYPFRVYQQNPQDTTGTGWRTITVRAGTADFWPRYCNATPFDGIQKTDWSSMKCCPSNCDIPFDPRRGEMGYDVSSQPSGGNEILLTFTRNNWLLYFDTLDALFDYYNPGNPTNTPQLRLGTWTNTPYGGFLLDGHRLYETQHPIAFLDNATNFATKQLLIHQIQYGDIIVPFPSHNSTSYTNVTIFYPGDLLQGDAVTTGGGPEPYAREDPFGNYGVDIFINRIGYQAVPLGISGIQPIFVSGSGSGNSGLWTKVSWMYTLQPGSTLGDVLSFINTRRSDY